MHGAIAFQFRKTGSCTFAQVGARPAMSLVGRQGADVDAGRRLRIATALARRARRVPIIAA
jgi:hypothetical protein